MIRVLVVDDEASIRLTLREALETMDCQTTLAEDGEEALRVSKEKDFDVVLLDLKLPGLDGMDVLRILRKEKPKTAIVIITAHGSVESAVDAMKLGAVDYLSKPFGLVDVRNAVREAIEQIHAETSLQDDYALNLEIARRALRRGEPDVAKRYVDKALELEPDLPQGYNLRGVIFEMGGRLFDAQQAYRKALDLDPNYAPATSNLRESVSAPTRTSFFLSEVKSEVVGSGRKV